MRLYRKMYIRQCGAVMVLTALCAFFLTSCGSGGTDTFGSFIERMIYQAAQDARRQSSDGFPIPCTAAPSQSLHYYAAGGDAQAEPVMYPYDGTGVDFQPDYIVSCKDSTNTHNDVIAVDVTTTPLMASAAPTYAEYNTGGSGPFNYIVSIYEGSVDPYPYLLEYFQMPLRPVVIPTPESKFIQTAATGQEIGTLSVGGFIGQDIQSAGWYNALGELLSENLVFNPAPYSGVGITTSFYYVVQNPYGYDILTFHVTRTGV